MVQYVILLPLHFNDGTPVPPELFHKTYQELLERFNGFSVDQFEVTGHWRYHGASYEDRLQRITVVGSADADTDAFMRRLKETLKQRFGQIEIWITAQQIDLI